MLAIIKWIFGVELKLNTEAAQFHTFSQTYVAIILFFILLCICLKRDLTIFMKMTSYGAIAIISILVFIIGVGFFSISNTNYRAVIVPEDN
jgi:amino acid permease